MSMLVPGFTVHALPPFEVTSAGLRGELHQRVGFDRTTCSVFRAPAAVGGAAPDTTARRLP
jgi:hypothetical protein